MKRSNRLINEITKLAVSIYVNNQCQQCKRILPNKRWFTDNGCKWCDAKYYKKDKKE